MRILYIHIFLQDITRCIIDLKLDIIIKRIFFFRNNHGGETEVECFLLFVKEKILR